MVSFFANKQSGWLIMEGMEMRVRITFFKWLTCIGFCGLLLFSVKTFREALPDHIYVKVGEAISYDFSVNFLP